MCSYFNSIKVRLNLQRRTFEVMRFAFQFHKGTIKPPVIADAEFLRQISIP